MCGIAGFVGSIEKELAHSLAEKLGKSLYHRGPDRQEYTVRTTALGIHLGLSHSLLAIIGKPGEGVQPFKVPGGILIFNGAIYNFKELRERLKGRGVIFHTETDTEVLAQGLLHHGLSFLESVRGMFAFAFWNEKENALLLGRDPFGVKPLYWTRNSKGIFFASEYKALLPHLSSLTRDEKSIYDYLRLRYVPAESTLFKEIRKVPTATVFEINCTNLTMKEHRYFSLLKENTGKTQEVSDLLFQAIGRRSIADVEVAALLSGGIDSAIVCDVLERHVKTLQTYTLGFPGEAIDESSSARQISEGLGARNTLIEDAEPNLNTLSELAFHLDDPYGDPIILALDRIFSSIKGKQRVLVTGEGSDEIFSGYVHHRILGMLERIPYSMVSSGTFLSSFLPVALIKMIFPYAGKLSLEDYIQAKERLVSFCKNQSLFSFQSIFFLFDDTDFVEKGKTYLETQETSATLQSLRSWDLKQWLTHSQLFKLDKTAMKHGIEAREPFVDQDLIHHVMSIPSREHVSLLRDKPVLRRALQGKTRLSPKVVNGRKASFFRPFTKDKNATVRKEIRELIGSRQDFLSQYVKKSTIETLLSCDGTGLLTQKKLFALGMFSLWYERLWKTVGNEMKCFEANKRAA